MNDETVSPVVEVVGPVAPPAAPEVAEVKAADAAMKDIDPDNDDQRKAVMAKLKEGGDSGAIYEPKAGHATDAPEKIKPGSLVVHMMSNGRGGQTPHMGYVVSHGTMSKLKIPGVSLASSLSNARAGRANDFMSYNDIHYVDTRPMNDKAMSGKSAGDDMLDLPLSAQKPDMKVGNRNNADDQQRLNAMHDAATSIMAQAQSMHDMCVANGAECNCADDTESPEEEATETPQDEMTEAGKSAVKVDSDKSAKSSVFDFSYVKSLHLPYSEQYLKDVIAVKSISPNRIRGYLALWGDESKVDVEGEYFTGYKASKLTDFWDGKLGFPRPLTYDHAQNKGMDASPIIGSIDGMGDDSIGRWYEAELDKSHRYRKAVDKLISQRASGTSSDSAPQYVVREPQKSGAVWLKQWPLFAGALTPTPAEPRMFDAGSLVWKSLSGEIEAARMGNVPDGIKAEMAAYARQLELIKLYL